MKVRKKGIDLEEIFSPVVKMSSIRVVLGLAASMNLEIEQLGVKTAFLHPSLVGQVTMEEERRRLQEERMNILLWKMGCV